MKLNIEDNRLIITDPEPPIYLVAAGFILVGIIMFLFLNRILQYSADNLRELLNLGLLTSILLALRGVVLVASRRRFVFYRNKSHCSWFITYFGIFKTAGEAKITDIDCDVVLIARCSRAFRLVLRNANQITNNESKFVKKPLFKRGYLVAKIGRVSE